MRIPNVLSGVAVLLTTLAFGHLLHRYIVDAPHGDPAFWAMLILAVVVGLFSFPETEYTTLSGSDL
jgi:peptidoglycan/LPS O-acetylase OafA/YrhL